MTFQALQDFLKSLTAKDLGRVSPTNARIAFFVLCAIALLYLICLPVTVQNLDSGEIVANSYAFNVLHPSGYPLIAWLFALVTHVFWVGSIFFRAAFFNAGLALATIACVYFAGRRSITLAACLMISLAVTPAFWRYAVIPDVFMLHCLLTAAFMIIYFLAPRSSFKILTLALIFALGAANHLTIIFCLPMLLEELIYQGNLKAIAVALLTGLIVTVLFYLSIFLMHPSALYSWGYVHDIFSLVPHFLRAEYGTFQLSGHAQPAVGTENVVTFFLELLLGLPAVVIALIFGAQDRRAWTAFVSIAIYILLILPFSNSNLVEILERFYLMPFVMVAVLASYMGGQGLRARQIARPAILAVSLASVAFHLFVNFQDLNFSRKTVIEDYARNLLMQTDKDHPTLLIVEGDSRLFPLRYLQLTEDLRPHVIAIDTGLIYQPAFLEKMKAKYPKFRDEAGVPPTRDIVARTIKPNLAEFDVITTQPVALNEFATTYFALGRRYTPGVGQEIDLPSLEKVHLRSDASQFAPSLKPNEEKALFSEYAYVYLKAGLRETDPAKSLEWFEHALAVVPYCIPAAQNICQMKARLGQPTDECQARLDKIKQTEFNYY